VVDSRSISLADANAELCFEAFSLALSFARFFSLELVLEFHDFDFVLLQLLFQFSLILILRGVNHMVRNVRQIYVKGSPLKTIYVKGSLLKVITEGVRFAWKLLTVLAIKLDPPLPLALQDVTWTVPPFPLAIRGDVDGTAIATGDTGHVGT